MLLEPRPQYALHAFCCLSTLSNWFSTKQHIATFPTISLAVTGGLVDWRLINSFPPTARSCCVFCAEKMALSFCSTPLMLTSLLPSFLRFVPYRTPYCALASAGTQLRSRARAHTWIVSDKRSNWSLVMVRASSSNIIVITIIGRPRCDG